MDYSGFELFEGITPQEVSSMIVCFQMHRKTYAAEELICAYGAGSREVGVLLQGSAEVRRIDSEGNRTILQRLEQGAVFGEMLAFTAPLGDSVEVISGGCEVLFMEYAHIMKRCEKACSHHSRLVQNLFGMVTKQTRQLSRRVEVLSRRSIREKLLCYFALCRTEAGSDSFELPFTLSTLAEFISTDRSAMMREIRKMREEGIVALRGRHVTMLTPETGI